MGLFSSKKTRNNIKSVDEPIDGYKMINLFKGVKVRRLGVIPQGTQLGSQVVLMYQAANKSTCANVSLLLVPQKKLFGHIDDEIIGKEIIRCIKNSDKSVARITYFNSKPYEYESAIDIAFFKKNK